MNKKVYTKRSAKHGKGVFARIPIKRGDVILIYTGESVTGEELDVIRATRDSLSDDYTLQLEKDLYFYITDDVGRYTNHSCDPNSGIIIQESEPVLIALRDIETDEEICFDYSTFTGTDDWSLECRCDAKNCRGSIKDFYSLPKKIRNRYMDLGIVPKFSTNFAYMDDKMKTRIQELVKEEISIVPYDSAWPEMFEDEAAFLHRKLPRNLVRRIEHFGSTAVHDLSAKPIIDILVEVSSLEKTKKQIVPILEAEGYEYFWRPAFGDNGPPYYAWFIKRNSEGKRTHHIHMVEADSELWDRIYFRDYLRQFPAVAKQYDELKRKLSDKYTNDRVKYTEEKSDFILSVTKKAKEFYESQN